MKDDSQVAYVPDIGSGSSQFVVRSVYCLQKIKKKDRFTKSSESSRWSYFADVDGPLFNEVLDVMF